MTESRKQTLQLRPKQIIPFLIICICHYIHKETSISTMKTGVKRSWLAVTWCTVTLPFMEGVQV